MSKIHHCHYCSVDTHANISALLLLCCGRKLKLYKYTQPHIGTPEPLPETGVLANKKPRKSDILTESQSHRVTESQRDKPEHYI